MAFDKFTLLDVRTSVRRKIGDTDYDADTIDECANDFQFELFNDNRIRFMEKSSVLSVLEDATSIPFPDDFNTILNLVVYDSITQYRNITKNYLSYEDFMKNNPMFAIASAQRIGDFTFFGEGIRLAAPSNGDYSVLLDYLRIPTLLSEAATEWELPRTYKEMAVLGTLEKVLFVDESLDTADFALERLASLRTSFIRNYGRGSGKVGPQIMGQGRGRSSYRVDRDF